MPTDWLPEVELGQCLDEEGSIIKSFAPGGAITKGAPVKFSDKSVWPPEVVAAGNGERCIGIALKAATGAGVPEAIPVLVDGWVKATIGAALACGVALKIGTAPKLVAALAADHNVACAILMQKTTADGDYAAVYFKANFLGVGT